MPFSRTEIFSDVGASYSVLPLQPGCPHVQSISGVFSIASHCGLQYFPEVTVQEQTGCAHFLPSAFAMLISFPAHLLIHAPRQR